MIKSNRNYANLSIFRSATPKILSGDLLKDVRKMQSSILRNGLESPLVAAQNRSCLIVIDGRKRLLALRRLQFNNRLPSDLVEVPYLEVKVNHDDAEERVTLNPVKIYRHIKSLQISGRSISEIARLLALPKDNVRNFLKIDRLSPRLLQRFLDHSMSMSQVLAFATLPNPHAQDELFTRLGPLASENDILEAIEQGQTVLAVCNDNVIILPTRRARPSWPQVKI